MVITLGRDIWRTPRRLLAASRGKVVAMNCTEAELFGRILGRFRGK